MIAIYKDFNIFKKIFSVLQVLPYSSTTQGILKKVIKARINPRDFTYMQNCAYELYGSDIPIIEIKDDSEIEKIAHEQSVLLLWPDSIGISWNKIEKKLRRANCDITVLNGRKRRFDLSEISHTQLLLKRFLDTYFIGEFIFSFFFILFTPVFLFLDLIRGKI